LKKKSQFGGELSKMTYRFNIANKNYSVIIQNMGFTGFANAKQIAWWL